MPQFIYSLIDKYLCFQFFPLQLPRVLQHTFSYVFGHNVLIVTCESPESTEPGMEYTSEISQSVASGAEVFHFNAVRLISFPSRSLPFCIFSKSD